MRLSLFPNIGGTRFVLNAIRRRPARWLQLVAWMALCSTASASTFEFLGVEGVFANFPGAADIRPYTIIIALDARRFEADAYENEPLFKEYFVYQTRGNIEGQVYYFLALGNFSSAKTAQLVLQKLKPDFTEAWIYRRSPDEIKQLALYSEHSATSSERALAATNPDTVLTRELLQLARDEFIDGNYTRVIAITDKITLTGNLEQVREALELAGITRERQRKFTQAVRLYETLLDTQPDSDTRRRIEARLDGIRTMSLTPKPRMVKETEKVEPDPWSVDGVIQQYYYDDRVDDGDKDLESVNRALVSDLHLLVQRRTSKEKIVMEFEGGLVDDFIEDSTESRIGRASIEYARDEFSLVGGRQLRTLTGVYDRFDGFTLMDLSHSGYQLGFAFGYLVQSSYDGTSSDQPFLGINLNLNPSAGVDVSIYAIHQQILDLTDRQSVGSEVEFLGENSNAYGAIDYDVFYSRLNNLSLASNYRFDANWSLDLGMNYGSSPPLSTINALQGQPVESMKELQDRFGDDDIYQLAEDRTSDSLSLFSGANYRLDADRYLYFSLYSLSLEATEASGGVERIPSYRELQVAVDYSFPGFLFERDYATIGTRISDSTSSEIYSLYARTRISSGYAMSYDPGLQVDLRKGKDNGVEQTIVKPSLKVTYRHSDTLSFESIFGIEYSNVDLPELDEQYTYSLYVGYYYLF